MTGLQESFILRRLPFREHGFAGLSPPAASICSPYPDHLPGGQSLVHKPHTASPGLCDAIGWPQLEEPVGGAQTLCCLGQQADIAGGGNLQAAEDEIQGLRAGPSRWQGARGAARAVHRHCGNLLDEAHVPVRAKLPTAGKVFPVPYVPPVGGELKEAVDVHWQTCVHGERKEAEGPALLLQVLPCEEGYQFQDSAVGHSEGRFGARCLDGGVNQRGRHSNPRDEGGVKELGSVPGHGRSSSSATLLGHKKPAPAGIRDF